MKTDEQRIAYNAYMREYRKLDLVKDAAIQKTSHDKRKDKKKIYDRLRYTANKPAKLAQNQSWVAANKETVAAYKRDYQRNRRQTDPIYHLLGNLRTLIGDAIKRKGFKKNSRTEQILGCAIQEFKIHLEKQFEPWMNWNNYGKCNGELKFGWDIDHVIPVATALTEQEIIQLNHYTNLRPLDSHVNRHIINKIA